MIALGAIGLGGLGQQELNVYAERDDVKIIAGADISETARAAFEDQFDVPAYENYQTLLDQYGSTLDAVNIVTPHTLHYDQTVACLERNLHVFLEKPMVTDVKQAQKLVSLTDEQDRILQIGYQRHFHPAYQEIKKIIERGDIGSVHTVNCFLGQDWIRRFSDAWRADITLSGGGQLYDSGSHLLDTLLWTTGATPQQVASVIDKRDHGVDINSALAITLEKEGQPITASVGITADGTSTSGTEEGLFIWGTKGRIAFNKSGLTVYGKGEGDDGPVNHISVETDPGFKRLLNRKLSAFVEAIENNEASPVSPKFGLTVTALTEAAYQSEETDQIVQIDSILSNPSPKRMI